MFIRPLNLDAGLTAKEASERLAIHAGKAYAVVRRVAGHEVLFHLITVKALQEATSAAAPDLPLEIVLSLGNTPGTQLKQVNKSHDLNLDPMVPEVLVDGFEVVGALVPDPNCAVPAAAPPPSPPQPGARRFSPESLSPLPPRVAKPEAPAVPPEPPDEPQQPKSLPYKRFLGIKIYPTGGLSHSSGPAIVQVAPASVQTQQMTAQSQQAVQTATVMVGLQAPRAVAAGQPFELGIKFSPVARPTPKGLADYIREAGRKLVLEAQVIANRFEGPGVEQHRITVPLAQPAAASLTVPMVAPPPGQDNSLARLLVLFSAGGQFAGAATHRMLIGQEQPSTPRGPGSNSVNWLGPRGPQPLWAKLDETPPDLTVILVREETLNAARERYQMRFVSPHPVALPTGLALSLDRDAASFALELIKDVNQHQGDALVSNVLKARARKIAGLLPAAFWGVLRAIWDLVQVAHQRAPTLFWLSSEHHIPWELCWLEQPLDAAQPPFLGAQVAMGRWVLSEGDQPQPWPFQNIQVQQMAVMVGDYAAESGLRPLPHATEEGEALEQQFQAKRFSVTRKDLKRLLDGKLGEGGQVGVAQAVHFACHGEAAPTIIYLDQGTPFMPVVLESADWPKEAHPFLFMNACQVGNAGEFLGECAGFAGSSLRAGFAGFLAPLWSVVDEDAKAFALRFYQLAFSGAAGTPLPIGEILRQLRTGYDLAADNPRVTPMAYAFYGNPALRLSRSPGTPLYPGMTPTGIMAAKPGQPSAFGPEF